jgi:hypothetical protein
MDYGWIYSLVLVGIIFLLANYYLSKEQDLYLESFRPVITKIIEKSGYPVVNFEIYPSKTQTYTWNKKKIYLVSRKKTGERFNKDTLLFVLLHEIAHILTTEHHHTSNFKLCEKKLYKTAYSYDYLDFHQVDKSYPCFG